MPKSRMKPHAACAAFAQLDAPTPITTAAWVFGADRSSVRSSLSPAEDATRNIIFLCGKWYSLWEKRELRNFLDQINDRFCCQQSDNKNHRRAVSSTHRTEGFEQLY
jgi:hypothetical protein